MKLINKLKKLNACKSGIEWFESKKTEDLKELFRLGLKEKRYSDLNWGISRLLNKKDRIKYAVFAAKQVLKIYEEKYPKDKRPRLAIKVAENYLKNPTDENKKVAAYAADAAVSAADAAYVTYIASAADAAAYAADAAASAADAAASAADAADAAYAAADATDYAAASAADAAYVTYTADAADAAEEKMQIKILKYGYKLLEAEK